MPVFLFVIKRVCVKDNGGKSQESRTKMNDKGEEIKDKRLKCLKSDTQHTT